MTQLLLEKGLASRNVDEAKPISLRGPSGLFSGSMRMSCPVSVGVGSLLPFALAGHDAGVGVGSVLPFASAFILTLVVLYCTTGTVVQWTVSLTFVFSHFTCCISSVGTCDGAATLVHFVVQ